MNEENVSGDNLEAAAPVETEVLETTTAVEPERQVPLDALQAERSERQKLQDEVRMLKDHMQIMQANNARPPEKPKDDFDGLADDDVLTVGEFKKAISKKEQLYQANIQELRMTQKHPDYADVVTKYLPEIIKQNPSLGQTLQRGQDFDLAYYLAKNSDAYKADHKRVKKHADAERIVQNAGRTGSLSSMGSTSPISQAKQYATMSDADFKKLVNKNMGSF